PRPRLKRQPNRQPSPRLNPPRLPLPPRLPPRLPAPLPPLTASDARSGMSRGVAPPVAVRSASLGASIVTIAMRYIGARYRFGGMSPSGFDCSGFVCYVVNKAGRGISRDMYSQIGSGARVSSNDLQPGDLLFFSNTYKRGLSHAGIYIG